MKWTVEGADARTGAEGSMTVDAHSQAEAEAVAGYKGLLAARSYPARAQGPFAQPNGESPRRGVPAPEYRDVVRDAGNARALASIAGGLAWALVVIGVAIFAVPMIRMRAAFFSSVAAPLVTAWGVTALVTAVWVFIIAAALRLFATLALAHRDLVRNSFRG